MRSGARPAPAVLLVMGVAGAGKTTVGHALSQRLGWTFLEADELHPPANIDRMAAGIPLDDADRIPWLDALRHAVDRRLGSGDDVVTACSALRRSYRERLLAGLPRTAIVHLHGDRTVLARRLDARTHHFMPPRLLDSQLALLEPPAPLADGEPLRFGAWTDRALALDVAAPASRLVEQAIARIGD